MKWVRTAIFHFCVSLALVGCGGGHLSVDLPEGKQTLDLDFPGDQAVEHLLPGISGGIRPYQSSIDGCPDWVTLIPDRGTLVGTGPAVDSGKTFSCSFRVTESDPGFRPARSVSYGLRLTVSPPPSEPPELSVDLPEGKQTLDLEFPVDQAVEHLLPPVSGGIQPYESSIDGCPDWVTLFADQGTLAGTGPAVDRGKTFFCTFRVTESDPGFRPARSVSYGLRLTVSPPPSEPPELSVDLPEGKQTLDLDFPGDQAVEHRLPPISGGIRPYESSIEGCPDWVTLFTDQGTLAGTGPAVDSGKTFFCTFRVTESDPGFRPARSVSYGLRLTVSPPPSEPPELSVDLPEGKQTLDLEFPVDQAVEHLLPPVSGGIQPYESSIDGCPDWVTLFADQGTLAGTGPVVDSGKTFFCTFRVTESDPGFRPARSVSYGLRLTVAVKQPLELPMDILEDEETFGRVDVPTVVTDEKPHKQLTFKIGRFGGMLFPVASGGVEPYTYELVDCVLPAGLEFHSNTRVLSGTPNAEYRGANCTYRVTDSSSASVSRSLVLVVEPLENRAWRFRTRTVEPGHWCLIPRQEQLFEVATLPRAHGGEGSETYAVPGAPFPPDPPYFLSFDPDRRALAFTNPDPPPVLGTPNTYRYLVKAGPNENDALCLDFQIAATEPGECPSESHILVQLRVRDDAFWEPNANWDPNANDGMGGYLGEYRCPDTTAPLPRRPIFGEVSNPVHEALGPVHARRATEVAHAAVRDRVRRWSPGSEQASFAVTPEVGLASLSGQSEGFDYTGNSESATFGAETGAGAWQAGLVASFTGTDLHYRAAAGLSERGYRTGEHDTDILSLHPFAAWHAPTGGHLWASLGAGIGRLGHRDDPGFPSWSDSDVRLFTHAVGASVPVADVLSGELQAEAGIDSFAFDIEGGDRISSSLPTMRGLDYRAGLAWSAPVVGAPSVSIAYTHLTGDGPEGGQLEARGSVSVDGVIHPRLTLTGNAGGSFGLGDYEQDSWRLGGGVRFAPESRGRGFGLDLDTRLVSRAAGHPAGVGIRSEAGYGLWGGPFFGMMRPHVGLIRHSGDQSVRRIFGLDLHGTSSWPIKFEVHDHSSDQSPAFRFSLRHRF